MENEIQIGRVNRLLQKLFNMKGPVPSPQLSGDVVPVFVLENDRLEWGFLSGESPFAGEITSAASVGNFSIAGIFNGQATGALVVVDAIVITNPTAGALAYNISIGGTTALSGTTHPLSTDMRYLGKQSTAAIGSAAEAARTGQLIYQVSVPANDFRLIPLRVVLPPNATPTPTNGPPNVYVEGTTTNTQILVNFVWHERALEPSEGPTPGA